MMRPEYRSTRGQSPVIPFDEALLRGLAPDGGLYVPARYPRLPDTVFAEAAYRPYPGVAASVVQAFADEAGAAIASRAYDGFAHPATAPLVQTGPDDFLLELFHGPTLAFKDVAMQWLGPLFSHVLGARGARMTIVAATSGDTGGAAVEAMAGRDGVGICILHPHGRISEVQRRFMTTVEAPNVLNLAVEGSFDDCQHLVKAMFADEPFRTRIGLGAVNSINWARIVAQVVYYVTTATRLARPGAPVSFAVPTGNFGDIFAGYVAKRAGAPIGTLIVATNENDILDRCLKTGAYAPAGVKKTNAPSMDIQVSSNFERLLDAASGGDSPMVVRLMQDLKEAGRFTLPENVHRSILDDFASVRVSETAAETRMRQAFMETGMLLDPHTAIGLEAAAQMRHHGLDGPIVTLATAHPAKFPAAVEAATGTVPPLPARCRDLYGREETMTVVPADLSAIEDAVEAAFPAP